MAFIPLLNGMRVVMEYSLAGQQVVNVYHVVSDDPIITVNLEQVALLFLAFWDDDPAVQLSQIISSEMALERIVVTDVSAADGEQFVYEPTTPIPGVSADDAIPNNGALVVGLRSTFTGRSRRGRNYYAGIPETVTELSMFTAPTVVWVLEALDDLAQRLDAEGYALGVASYVSAGAPRVTALFTPTTVFSADSIVDSQRRRLPGRGA